MKNITLNEARRFWNRNIKLISVLLAIWFAVSYGVVILLGDVLSSTRFLGTSLPFWFGQQGSVVIFLGLLIIYAVAMNRITGSITENAPGADVEWPKTAVLETKQTGVEVMS